MLWFTLSCRKDLRHDYDKACVQFFLRVEFPEISRIVRHKSEIAFNDAGHQIPVRFTAQSQPVHMGALVTKVLRHGHERGVKAFIDQELQEEAPEDLGLGSSLSDRRVVDFAVNPWSESFLGRPRAGWAAVQISASSTMCEVIEG